MQKQTNKHQQENISKEKQRGREGEVGGRPCGQETHADSVFRGDAPPPVVITKSRVSATVHEGSHRMSGEGERLKTKKKAPDKPTPTDTDTVLA